MFENRYTPVNQLNDLTDGRINFQGFSENLHIHRPRIARIVNTAGIRTLKVANQPKPSAPSHLVVEQGLFANQRWSDVNITLTPYQAIDTQFRYRLSQVNRQIVGPSRHREMLTSALMTSLPLFFTAQTLHNPGDYIPHSVALNIFAHTCVNMATRIPHILRQDKFPTPPPRPTITFGTDGEYYLLNQFLTTLPNLLVFKPSKTS